MTAPTPRPWLHEHCTVYALTGGPHERPVNRFSAQVQGGGPRSAAVSELAANAAFIVRSVNAHDDLVAALKAAEEELRLIRMKDHGTVYNPGLSVQIRLALAKAGEP